MFLLFCRFLLFCGSWQVAKKEFKVSIAFLLVIFCIQFASRVCSAVHWCNSWYGWMHVYHCVYIFTYLLWFLYFVCPFQFSLDYSNNFRIGYCFIFDFLVLTLYIILAFYIYSKYRNSNNICPFNSPTFRNLWKIHINIWFFIKQIFMSLEENKRKVNYFIYLDFYSGGSDNEESAHNAWDQVQSLDQEDPLEKGMATHFSILA